VAVRKSTKLKKCFYLAISIIILAVSITGYKNFFGIDSGLSFSSIKSIAANKSIPIISYHCISKAESGNLTMYVSPQTFEKQIKYIKDNGYTPISFGDINNADKIHKPVIITFDDGYEDNFTNAYPILRKYKVKATVFLIADFIGKPNYLSISQINSMKDIIDFESHTMSHRRLTDLNPEQMEYEISKSKTTLENLLNKKIDVIAYPYGSYNEKTIEITKKYYSYGVTFTFGKYKNGVSDDFKIRRITKMDLSVYKGQIENLIQKYF
jgi:peptidoglycan/xylan/chitin deacetylase (PgdA/CDA1 family)